MPRLTRLILVKHSMPRIEPEKPACEWHLSDEGLRRCNTLADALAPYQPDIFVSSDEPKAVETAERVAARFGRASSIVAGLHEHDRRNVGFLSTVEFEARVKQFFHEPHSLVFGNESADQAYARFAKAVEGVLTQRPSPSKGLSRSIVIVAHGTVISLFVAHAVGLDALDVWKRLGLPSFAVLLALPNACPPTGMGGSLPGFKLEGIVDGV